MKKILFLLLIPMLYSNSYMRCDQIGDANYDWAITVKNGYFYPQDKTLREIFCQSGNKGGYWFETALRYNIWKKLDIEANGSYFGKNGKALCSNECTNVKIPTLGLGLKYFFHVKDYIDSSKFLDKISLFVGAGLKTFFYRENNKSIFVAQCVKKTAVGGMFNLGLEYTTKKNFFIDLFFDYNVKKLRPCYSSSCNTCEPSCRFDIDLGGFVTGIGLGYKF